MKRQFEGFNLPAKRLEHDPSKEYVDPKPVEAKVTSGFDEYDELFSAAEAATAASGLTDFSQWSEAELRTFLDQRGEDFDDCRDRDALMERARECEANTGPAVRPTLPGATAHDQTAAAGSAPTEEGEEVDPLDAFMAEMKAMEDEAKAEAGRPADGGSAPPEVHGRPSSKASQLGERMESDDHVADYVEALGRRKAGAAAPAAARGGGDSDEEVYAVAKAAEDASIATAGGWRGGPDAEDATVGLKRDIESLQPLAHDAVQYDEFNKEFYEPPPEMAALDPGAVTERRRALGIRVSGYDVPAPVETFAQCGFEKRVMMAIGKAGYEHPTPIQAQALPVALSGRDVLGIAKTGSGKTAAFILPMIVHIMDQPELAKGEGPIALIAAPTRELAEQIHREARKLARPYQLRICAAFGGLPKQQQFKELRAGAEVAVCTPGRMIDLIKMKACTTRRVTYLVFDEADRMFDLGFEPQVRSLMGQVRPDRQTLLFSATMPRKMERLAAEALTAPVRITVGTAGGANEDVRQVVEVVGDDGAKMQWLSSRLAALVDDGDVLVFANQKARVDALSSALEALGVARVAAIHGDMDQASRMEVLGAFKAGQVHVLVATDVAARGLDIKSIKTVVNYDAAKDIETHVHRVGRTGRAGDKEGVAYTLLLPTETKAAADLVRCLAAAGQDAPHAVHEMAMRDSKFKRGEGRGKGKRGAQGRPKGPQVGGSGLGFGPSGNGGGSAAPAAQTGSYASGLAGFAPSHDGADAHFLTAARPTPPGQLAARVPPPTVAPPAQAVPAATPVPSPPPGFAAQAAAAPPLPQPPQKGPQAEYIEARHAAVGQQFKSSFVSSGLRQGDVDAKPQIVLPKSSTIRQGAQAPGARAPPPPPVPVTQMPLYLQQRPQFGRGRGSGGGPPAPVAPMVHGGGGASVPSGLQQGPAGGPSAAAVQSDSVQRAIAQARAIAERLAAKGGGGGGGGQGSQWKWGGG